MENLTSDNNLEFCTVNRKYLDELVGLVEELVINKVRIENMKNELSSNSYSKVLDQELRITSQIQDSIKKVRLIKIKTLANFLQDLIVQYNQEYNMSAELLFEGQETEVESSFIAYIRTISIYFIKNIYQSELKAAGNQIKISASSDGKNLTTIIEDNGAGFDDEAICKILNKERLDLLSLNENDMRKFFTLINFAYDIDEFLKLKSELAYLDGNIRFESKLNQYRRIKITVPLSSSIMQGLLVKIGNQVYALPLDYIETIINKNAVSIKSSNNTEIIVYMDEVFKLKRLSQLLNVETTEEASCILIVNANGRRAALLVDSLLDQTDMVIKPKHQIVKDVVEIKGTTILGDGLVTLVLDVPSILKDL